MEATAYGAIVLAGGGARRMGGARKPVVRVGGVPMIERVLAAVAPAGAPLVVGPSDLVLPPGVAVIQEAPPGGGPAAAVAAAFAASPGPPARIDLGPIDVGLADPALADPAPIGLAPIGLAPIGLAPLVAIVAGDLPLLTVQAVSALLDAAGADSVDGAVYVDTDDRPQWLCGAWRTSALAARIATLARDRDQPGLAGVALRDLFGALSFARLPAHAALGSAAVAEDTRPTDSTSHTAVGRPDGQGAGGGAGPASGRADDLPPWFDCDTEDDIRRAEEWLTR